MMRVITLGLVAIVALAGCGDNGPYNSSVQAQPGTSRSRLATEPAFIQAQNGTLYSIDCLRTQGSAIAAGNPNAGRNCAVDKLSESQVRGLRGFFGRSSNFSYINPIHYFGGNQTSSFCSVYFGWSWNGCFQWLGYGAQQFNTQYFYPECRDCMFTMSSNNPSSGWGFGSPGVNPQPGAACPNYCRYVSSWNSQPWFQNWNRWNWWSWY